MWNRGVGYPPPSRPIALTPRYEKDLMTMAYSEDESTEPLMEKTEPSSETDRPDANSIAGMLLRLLEAQDKLPPSERNLVPKEAAFLFHSSHRNPADF
jgi:hypothetical protein